MEKAVYSTSIVNYQNQILTGIIKTLLQVHTMTFSCSNKLPLLPISPVS